MILSFSAIFVKLRKRFLLSETEVQLSGRGDCELTKSLILAKKANEEDLRFPFGV